MNTREPNIIEEPCRAIDAFCGPSRDDFWLAQYLDFEGLNAQEAAHHILEELDDVPGLVADVHVDDLARALEDREVV